MRVFLLAAFLLCISIIQAQRTAQATTQANRERVVLRGMVFDTLLSPTLFEPCSDEVEVVISDGDDGDGFVAGSNNFLDKEKAILLTYAGGQPYTITDVVAYFFPPDDAAAINQRELVAFVSSVESDGSPGELLGESEPIAIQDLNVAEGQVLPTIFKFTEPVEVTGDAFFVSIDFTDIYESETGNIGLWMTIEDCADDPNPSWELWDDFSWNNIESSDTWGLKREWLIGAIIETQPASAVDQQMEDSFKLGPNPTFGEMMIEFEQARASRVQVEVSTSGSANIKTYDLGLLPAGLNQESLNLAGLPAGLYYVRITNEEWSQVEAVVVK